ncbi:MAG: serine/threonine protein kinase [Planctomycetes bacterium]|nr:serine/threonine protein kinase [Planctomycetota bacterium]
MPATDPSKDRGGRAGEDVRAAADTRRLPEEVTDWFVREPVGERVSPIVPAPGGAGPVDMPDLRVVTDGRYAEFEFVGRGGMGSVYRALDRETNRRVALKIVRTEGERIADPLSATAPPTGTADHALFLRTAVKFLQEAWVTAGLEHPGVIPVYEVARTKSGVPFYTMRYLAGRRTLDKAIEESGGLDDRLALLDAFLTVCGAVEYAHTRGVVHRDLKPSNIGLGAFGEVVVFDWGLARLLGRPDSEADRWRARIRDLRRGRDPHEPQGVFGTPGYLSPEAVFGGPEETDERSDVYALGVILYRILTKRLPFDFAELPGCSRSPLGGLCRSAGAEPRRADPVRAGPERRCTGAPPGERRRGGGRPAHA